MGGVASRVRDIATVLERLSESFEADGGCCSSHMLDDVRQIISSCTSTFEELDKAIEGRRSGRIGSLQWPFKKTNVKEIEARLDSEKSTLVLAIQTLTVGGIMEMKST